MATRKEIGDAARIKQLFWADIEEMARRNFGTTVGGLTPEQSDQLLEQIKQLPGKAVKLDNTPVDGINAGYRKDGW